MNRRSMLGAVIGLIAATFIPRAWARPNYPAFVRDGLLLTPTWTFRKVGERAYNVSYGDFCVCQRAHWELGTRVEPTVAIDSGSSPRELGFLETPWAKVQFDASTWKDESPALGWQEGYPYTPLPEPRWVKGLLA